MKNKNASSQQTCDQKEYQAANSTKLDIQTTKKKKKKKGRGGEVGEKSLVLSINQENKLLGSRSS